MIELQRRFRAQLHFPGQSRRSRREGNADETSRQARCETPTGQPTEPLWRSCCVKWDIPQDLSLNGGESGTSAPVGCATMAASQLHMTRTFSNRKFPIVAGRYAQPTCFRFHADPFDGPCSAIYSCKRLLLAGIGEIWRMKAGNRLSPAGVRYAIHEAFLSRFPPSLHRSHDAQWAGRLIRDL